MAVSTIRATVNHFKCLVNFYNLRDDSTSFLAASLVSANTSGVGLKFIE